MGSGSDTCIQVSTPGRHTAQKTGRAGSFWIPGVGGSRKAALPVKKFDFFPSGDACFFLLPIFSVRLDNTQDTD